MEENWIENDSSVTHISELLMVGRPFWHGKCYLTHGPTRYEIGCSHFISATARDLRLDSNVAFVLGTQDTCLIFCSCHWILFPNCLVVFVVQMIM